MRKDTYEPDTVLEEITDIRWGIDSDEEIREIERELGIYYDTRIDLSDEWDCDVDV